MPPPKRLRLFLPDSGKVNPYNTCGGGAVISEQWSEEREEAAFLTSEAVAPHLALQRVTLRVCVHMCVCVCVCVCVWFNAFQHLGLNPERSPQSGVKGDTQLSRGR